MAARAKIDARRIAKIMTGQERERVMSSRMSPQLVSARPPLSRGMRMSLFLSRFFFDICAL